MEGLGLDELYAMLNDIANEGKTRHFVKRYFNIFIYSAPAYEDLDGNGFRVLSRHMIIHDESL